MKRQALPPSRFVPVFLSCLALDSHRMKEASEFSISQWTSSSRLGIFCTSSMMMGCFRASFGRARISSRSRLGFLRRSK